MVVAALVSAYAPASRGLRRRQSSRIEREIIADRERAAQRRWDMALANATAPVAAESVVDARGGRGGEETNSGEGNTIGSEDPSSLARSERFRSDGLTATPRKKRLKAMAALTSFASDFDVITDWYYFYTTYRKEKEYEEEGTNLLPPFLLNALFVSCIMGTIFWTILATDGRIVMRFLRPLGIEGLSTGYVLLLCVLVEDLPQVVITCLVDDYYENDETFSSVAALNLCTSVYDTMIKLAEAYDERDDIVETGAWCKATYKGHRKAVSSLAILPLRTAKEYHSPSIGGDMKSFDDETQATTNSTTVNQPSSRIDLRKSWYWSHRQLSVNPPWTKQTTQAELIARRTSPPFLTGSHDGTVRLWDPSYFRPCRKKFKCHKDWVTSVCVLGTNVGYASFLAYDDDDATSDKISPSKSFGSLDSADVPNKRSLGPNKLKRLKNRFRGSRNVNEEETSQNDVYFLTGSRDGTIKLWGISLKKPLKTYQIDDDECLQIQASKSEGSAKTRADDTNLEAVTSLLTLDPSTASHFVSGHRDASARLWDVVTGDCLCVYREHSGGITSLCGTGDGGVTFVTGSDDATAKLWDARRALGESGSSSMLEGFNNSVLDAFEDVGGWGGDKSSRGFGRESQYSSRARWSSPEEVGKRGGSGCAVPPSRVPSTVWAERGSLVVSNPKNTGLVPTSETEIEETCDSPVEEIVSVITFSGHAGCILSVAALEPKKTIVTGSTDGTAKIWCIKTGSCLRSLIGHKGAVSTVAAFDADVVLTGSFDRKSKLWDATTGTPLRTFGKHRRFITSVTPCGNGRTFLTASFDRSCRLWTVTTANTAPSLRAMMEEEEEEYYEGHGGGIGVLLS